MKKKILVTLLASVMTLSMLAGCGAKEEPKTESKQEEVKKDGEYQMVSPEDTVKAAGEKHVLDVREWGNYVAGRVTNSEWCPIFPLEDESLEEKMTAYAEEHLKDDKEIYIICNSGQRGAQKTTDVLKKAGIDEKLIFTVEGGAKALANVKGALSTNRTEEAIEWQYAKGADVLAEDGAQIVDVRDEGTYKEGHIDGSKHVALKEIESADAQTKTFELAGELDNTKPVYFLCYSGNKCAKTAISVFKDAGFPVENLFIMENGAKDKEVSAAFVK